MQGSPTGTVSDSAIGLPGLNEGAGVSIKSLDTTGTDTNRTQNPNNMNAFLAFTIQTRYVRYVCRQRHERCLSPNHLVPVLMPVPVLISRKLGDEMIARTCLNA